LYGLARARASREKIDNLLGVKVLTIEEMFVGPLCITARADIISKAF